MVRFFNPGGHNWGPANHDGWGILLAVFTVLFSLLLLFGGSILVYYRNHPLIKMRKIEVVLLSVVILHVYVSMALLVYPINGDYPCSTEFWIMSIFLPIGIGLFQVQNQQLLLISRGQNQLLNAGEHYRPLYYGRTKGIGGPRYWFWRFKLWWSSTSTQGKYEGFVVIGMFVQLIVSLVIFCISRKFSENGIVSHRASPAMCRRGWEWAPSIIWQLLWNFVFGPYLLWKIRSIHDTYHWRLQTTLSILAGFAGTPLWLAATYTDSFASINKYWIPAMWLVPGLITMEFTAFFFPILQIFKHKKAVRETQQALADFDAKKLDGKSNATSSLTTGTGSQVSKKGKMSSMESLDECLAGNHDGLQIYASCTEFNGENIVFLTKVIQFQKQWHRTFYGNMNYSRSLMTMFRAALSIYVQLIHSDTASYPINIESPIYAKLETIFGPAATLMASQRRGSSAVSIVSAATPWDAPTPGDGRETSTDEFPMHVMGSRPASCRSQSSDNMLTDTATDGLNDPLSDIIVPDAFDEKVFDAAFKSIKYMVWTETWQHYIRWRDSASPSA